MFRTGVGKISERLVWHLWRQHLPKCRPLRLTDGRQLRVLAAGRFNRDSGPDFLDARLTFGPGQPVKGDVEMHLHPTDWLRHGHTADPRYNAVALHVVMWNQGGLTVIKQNGQYVPTLVLSDNLTEDFERLQKQYESRKEWDSLPQEFPCARMIRHRPDAHTIDILEKAGWDRFLAKVRFLDTRMQRVSPEQTLYEGLMRAGGYSKNKESFLELSQRLPLATIREYAKPLPERERVISIQALLFGTAGLLPSQSERHEPVSDDPYVLELESRWASFSSGHRVRPMSQTSWQFFRLRPFNFPTIRLAGMSYLIRSAIESRCGNRLLHTVSTISSFTDGEGLKQLKKDLDGMLEQDESDYWTTHVVLGGKEANGRCALIGLGRRQEMMVNVILPFLYACALKAGQVGDQETNYGVYCKHPKTPEHSTITSMVENLFGRLDKRTRLIDSARLQQGLLHINQQTCYEKNCEQCLLITPSGVNDPP